MLGKYRGFALYPSKERPKTFEDGGEMTEPLQKQRETTDRQINFAYPCFRVAYLGKDIFA